MKRIVLFAILLSVLIGSTATQGAKVPGSRLASQAATRSFARSRGANVPVPKVGLVLGGGGAKGAAEVGVLKYIEEAGIKIDYIAGTSIGSIIGALYSVGYRSDDLDSLFHSQEWVSLLADRDVEHASNIFSKHDSTVYVFGFPIIKPKIKTPNHKRSLGLSRGDSLVSLFTRMTKQRDNINFGKLPIPFRCVAVNMNNFQEVVLSRGNLPSSMRASMAIPGVFKPVEMDSMLLVDGGLLNNLPVDVVKEMGADIVIAIDLTQNKHEGRKENEDGKDGFLSHISKLISWVIERPDLGKYNKNVSMADVYINPKLKGCSAADFTQKKIEYMIQQGEKAGREALPELKKIKRLQQMQPYETNEYAVNVNDVLQRNEGWGVSLCWWARMCGEWSDDKIDEIVDWLVSPEGLNYNIFRYNIGGGDDPENRHCQLHHMDNGKGRRAEMEGFKVSAESAYDWSRDAGQRKIMLKIKEKRPDAIFEAFSNTPPYYMTVSGCCAGNKNGGKDNLRHDCYEDFANYLVDVCKHYHDEYGIDFKTLEPFNEATTNFWGANGSQEGCHFDNDSQIKLIKILHPILKASGLKTVISASDETNVQGSIGTFRAYADAGILDMVGQWNTHTYGADSRSRNMLRTLCKDAGKWLWMSETGSGGNGIDGNLKMTKRLFDDIKGLQPAAWIDWQYMEEKNDQWCFIRGNFADATYSKVKNYYVRQQVTSHIRQGYQFVGNESQNTLSAISDDGKELVVVFVNTESEKVVHKVSIKGVNAKKIESVYQTSATLNHAKIQKGYSLKRNLLEIELPAQSITTVTIKVNL